MKDFEKLKGVLLDIFYLIREQDTHWQATAGFCVCVKCSQYKAIQDKIALLKDAT